MSYRAVFRLPVLAASAVEIEAEHHRRLGRQVGDEARHLLVHHQVRQVLAAGVARVERVEEELVLGPVADRPRGRQRDDLTLGVQEVVVAEGPRQTGIHEVTRARARRRHAHRARSRRAEHVVARPRLDRRGARRRGRILPLRITRRAGAWGNGRRGRRRHGGRRRRGGGGAGGGGGGGAGGAAAGGCGAGAGCCASAGDTNAATHEMDDTAASRRRGSIGVLVPRARGARQGVHWFVDLGKGAGVHAGDVRGQRRGVVLEARPVGGQ